MVLGNYAIVIIHTAYRGDLFFIDCRDYQYYQATSEDREMDWIHFEGGNSGAFPRIYEKWFTSFLH